MIPINWLQIGIAAGCLLIAFTSAWTIQGWRYGAKLSAIEAAQAEALSTAHENLDTAYNRIAELDTAHIKKLKKMKDENSNLHTRIAAGTASLHIKANCLPEGEGGSGVGNGTSPRLTQDAERAYFDHRNAIDLTLEQLSFCQGILKEERND